MFDPVHITRCRDFLEASGSRRYLLMNLGTPRADIKRIVLNL